MENTALNIKFLGTCACDFSEKLKNEFKDSFGMDERWASSVLVNGKYLIDGKNYNIVYPAFQLGEVKRYKIIKEVKFLMKEMGISAIAENDIHKVSGGQLQRAAICRAMINHPDILFGDELTGALNSSTTREVLNIIDNINKKGTTVLLVTHDANVAVHADKVIYLEDGRIMDTLNLGKYDKSKAEVRDIEMKNWLKKMRF